MYKGKACEDYIRMKGRINGSGLGFVAGLWGKSGEVEASPKNIVSP